MALNFTAIDVLECGRKVFSRHNSFSTLLLFRNELALTDLFAGLRDAGDRAGFKRFHSVWDELCAVIPRKKLCIQHHAFRLILKGTLNSYLLVRIVSFTSESLRISVADTIDANIS